MFHVTLDASGGSGSGSVAPDTTEQGSTSDRSVLVLRAERRCVAEPTPVREYLHRCATHRLTHRAKIEGTQFWSGDFAVRVGKVENMQGTYAGAVLEIEYGPVCFAAAAAPAPAFGVLFGVVTAASSTAASWSSAQPGTRSPAARSAAMA